MWHVLEKVNLPSNYHLDDVFVRIKNCGKKRGKNRNERMTSADYKSMITVGVKRGQTYLLMDDVITTGMSLSAARVLLKEAGAGDVYCLALFNVEYDSERYKAWRRNRSWNDDEW